MFRICPSDYLRGYLRLEKRWPPSFNTVLHSAICLAWLLGLLITAQVSQAYNVLANAPGQPVLMSEADSTRAIAFEAVSYTREPFAPTGASQLYGADRHTRVMLFATNLLFQPGEDISLVQADAEDGSHHHYNLTVEDVRRVSGHDWLRQVILRLSDDLGDVGDVLVKIAYRGVSSNRVRIGMGHTGGGPPDDPGSTPTQPAFTIGGNLQDDHGNVLDGVTVVLRSRTDNAAIRTVTTSSGGMFSFAGLPPGSDYTVAPANSSSLLFDPQNTGMLVQDVAFAFRATRRVFTISGQVSDGSTGLGGITVNLTGGGNFSPVTIVTSSGGNFSFAGVPAGYNYILSSPTTAFYTFVPQLLDNLISDRTISFIGTLRSYSISGVLTGDGNTPVPNLILSIYSTNGLFRDSVVNGPDGHYSITNLPASYTYVIQPYGSVIYDFPSQTIPLLGADQTLNVAGIRRVFTLSGVAADRSHNAVGGVNVTLTGPFNRSELTDSNGHYSFSGVPAGNNYQVTMSKIDYIFDPGMQTINFLVSNQVADFTAIRTYRISGRVTDEFSHGLIGATMTLSGAEAGTTQTNGDGSYSFTVTTIGNYSVTPSKEQNFYTFTPTSQSIPNLTSHQTANFSSLFSSITNPSYVLEFDGTPMTVDHGDFWPAHVELGHFFWEFWAMPGDNGATRYLVSDGYGGAHALLFGFSGGVEPGRYNLDGNIFDGVQSTSFGSSEGPAPGEWGHFAVGWDGSNIVMYFDGVPVGKQAFVGPRLSMGGDWGAGRLLIGGSDHNNVIGRIAQVHGYETSNPRESSPEASFAPQTVFPRDGNLLSYYFRPSPSVADLSLGYNATAHSGRLRSTLNGVLYECPGCPIPRFVLDPTAPNFSNPSNPGQIITTIDSPPATPSGVYIFDSFSRQNSTYILGGRGGLGSTETGSAGPRPWQTSADIAQLQPFGILNGRAVFLANEGSVAWVSTGSNPGNLDLRVDRHPHWSGSGVDTGLSFRVLDRNNYFFAYTSDEGGAPLDSKRLNVGYYQSGNRVILSSSVTMPNSWTTLRVITLQSGGISIFADTQLVYSTSSNILITASGAGLYNSGPGMGLANRWDNFSVFLLP